MLQQSSFFAVCSHSATQDILISLWK